MNRRLQFAIIILTLALLAACVPSPQATPTMVAPFVVPIIQPTANTQPTRALTTQPAITPTAMPSLPNLAPKKLAMPWQQRPSPRVLIDGDDIARIKQKVASDAWAKDALDSIIKIADAYPSQYLKNYNLASADLPTSGGQWSLWYICPDGLRLQYQPAHNPPHYCPSMNQYFASPPQWSDRLRLYDEVIFARRHDDLAIFARDAGLVYVFTGDKKYAENAAQILRGYAKLYPTYAHHDKDGKQARNGAKVHAQTLDEAIWLINIAWAYDLVSDTLPPADRDTIAKNVLRPAVAEIEGNRAGLSNWQTWHNAAIAAAGFALGDEKMVNEAYNDSQEGYFKQLADGAANDGFWWEGSWSYHFFTLNAMLDLAEMGTRAGLDTFASPNLRAMWNAPLQMAMPNLALPSFNDDGGTSIARQWMYEIAYQRYRDPGFAAPIGKSRGWRGLLWGAENLPSANSPVNASALLPKAGYAVMRGGENYLALKFGPFGGWHAHFDQLGYISFANNRILGFDPGTHSYASALHDTWDKSTVAHNTIVVDEQSQGEASGNLHHYYSLPAITLATADAGNAYPNRAAITRTLALTPDYWLDVARASSLDGKPHQFDWVYHNAGSLTIPSSFTPYSFANKTGYQNLTDTRMLNPSADLGLTWDLSDAGKNYGSVFHNNDDIQSTFTVAHMADCGGCGEMDYNWGTGANAYAVYQTKLLTPPTEMPTRMDARIFGDGSNTRLTFRVMDATGEKFIKDAGTISWKGWQTVTLAIDKTWSHGGAGNNDGVMDLPVSQVAIQLNRTANSPRAGRVRVDDIALTFANVGRMVMEEFPESHLSAKILSAPDTILVLGNGIDETNAPVPFVMARRNVPSTVFIAAFEPYRTAARIEKFEEIPVVPAHPAANAVRVIAPNDFTDMILCADDAPRGEKTFGAFSTDAASAFVRQDNSSTVQTLALANATKFSNGAQAWLTSSAPVTLQISYPRNVLAITVPDKIAAQLRVAAQNTTQVTINGELISARREGDYFVIQVR